MRRMSEKGEEPTAGTRPTRRWPCSRTSRAACSVAVVLMSLPVICGSFERSNLAPVFLAIILMSRFPSTRRSLSRLSRAQQLGVSFSCLTPLPILNTLAASSPRDEANRGSLKRSNLASVFLIITLMSFADSQRVCRFLSTPRGESWLAQAKSPLPPSDSRHEANRGSLKPNHRFRPPKVVERD